MPSSKSRTIDECKSCVCFAPAKLKQFSFVSVCFPSCFTLKSCRCNFAPTLTSLISYVEDSFLSTRRQRRVCTASRPWFCESEWSTRASSAKRISTTSLAQYRDSYFFADDLEPPTVAYFSITFNELFDIASIKTLAFAPDANSPSFLSF